MRENTQDAAAPTTPRKPRTVDELGERVRELHCLTPLANWNAFVTALDIPGDLAPAMLTGRPELLRLAQPRAMSAEETATLLKLVAGLIETNMALQQHARRTAQLVDHWAQQFRGLAAIGRQIEHFANFRDPSAPEDDESPDEADDLYRAAKVLQLTPHIRAYLAAHDSQALEQLERALGAHGGAP